MDQETFTKLVQMFHHLHFGAKEVAAIVVVPVLVLGILGGFSVAQWIFRGGLRRCARSGKGIVIRV